MLQVEITNFGVNFGHTCQTIRASTDPPTFGEEHFAPLTLKSSRVFAVWVAEFTLNRTFDQVRG